MTPTDRSRLLDELSRLAEILNSIGEGDPELLWCNLRLSVQRVGDLLRAVPRNDEHEELLVDRLAAFLDEIADMYNLGATSGRVDLPCGRRAQALIRWFCQQFAPKGDA